MDPKVSVIIPTYNGGKFLAYSIRSVLNQTHKNLEVWVVGDGSNDHSPEVVDRFEDHRVHWHNLEVNTGSQPAPNNYALKHAQGDYIAYLGHDDLWFPDHLETLLTHMQTHQLQFTIATMAMALPNGEVNARGHLPKHRGYRSHMPPSAWIYTRELVEQVGLWPEDYLDQTRGPDNVYFWRIVRKLDYSLNPSKRLTVIKFNSKNFGSYGDSTRLLELLAEYTNQMEQDADAFRFNLLEKISHSFIKHAPHTPISPSEGFSKVKKHFTEIMEYRWGNSALLRWYFVHKYRKRRKGQDRKRGLN